MTSLQKANNKIKDLEIQLKNEKAKSKMQKEYSTISLIKSSGTSL